MPPTNLECAKTVLEGHRDARMWDDSTVAADLLDQLGLDPSADAKNPKSVAAPDERETLELEATAADATQKAKASRDAFEAAKPRDDKGDEVAMPPMTGKSKPSKSDPAEQLIKTDGAKLGPAGGPVSEPGAAA